MIKIRASLVIGLFCLGSTTADSQTINVDRGDIQVRVPSAANAASQPALVVLLHGYSHTGQLRESEWKFGELVEDYGFVLAYPDGTRESSGNENTFWNASAACCNFQGSDVDDSTYIISIISQLTDLYEIDPKRIYLVGHSNGGFMSYRLAYDHSETIAAIASVAGAAANANHPAPPHPVNVLQIHGTADSVIAYEGGNLNRFEDTAGREVSRPYPGAIETVERWASYNGCTLEKISAKNRDLDRLLPGAETAVTQHTENCKNGSSSELWTINGGSHSPDISDSYSQQIVEWLLAHPKP